MTSNERRREARYQRRCQKRKEKRDQALAQYNSLERIVDFNSLKRANKRSAKNVGWKESVQRYQMSMLRNFDEIRNKVLNGEDISLGFVEFNLCERGKTRHIRSVHFKERVCQRSLCDNSLVPILSNSLIYDNTACQDGKGVEFAIERLETHLHKYYRHYHTNEGWILLFDFHSFFDSIDHEILIKDIRSKVANKEIADLVESLIRPFGYPFALGNWRHNDRRNADREYIGKGLGLGSQVSQISAVSYPSRIDHYMKEVLRVKYYGRYMDDGYMLFHSKDDAQIALNELKWLCKEYKLILNESKVQIAKLSRKFTYLKVRFTLTDTGKVYKQLTRKNVNNIKNRLTKLKPIFDSGALPECDLQQAYASWKGYALMRGAKKQVWEMDKLYRSLFGVEPPCVKLEGKEKMRERRDRKRGRLRVKGGAAYGG